ncbi:MAG: DUF4974 domain-containing protein [Bacteroidia bacterium]|nr:MAG: DUF4974 domain-containing protein [Bacteroidia bacterium]
MNSNLDYKILIAKFLSGEAKPEDKLELEMWLAKSEENRSIFEEYEAVWNLLPENAEITQFDSRSAWEKVELELDKLDDIQKSDDHTVIKPKIRSLRKTLFQFSAAAAIVIMIVSLVMFFLPKDIEMVTIYAETTEDAEYILPDGSSITMQAGATITYPRSFHRNLREVTLAGNAYFDVAADDMPFIVRMEGASVLVLGTSFYISRAEDNPAILEVSVVSGSVRLQSSDTESLSVDLTAGERAIFDQANQYMEQVKIGNMNFLAWKTGILEFNDDPLDYVFSILERNYKINIENNADLTGMKLTGRFVDEDLEDVFQAIAMIFDLEIDIHSGQVYIQKP